MTGSELELLLQTRLESQGLDDAKTKLDAVKSSGADVADSGADMTKQAIGARTAIMGLSSVANSGRLSFGALSATLRGMAGVIGVGGPLLAGIGAVTGAIGAWAIAYRRIKSAMDEARIAPRPEIDAYKTQIDALTTALDDLARSHKAADDQAQQSLSNAKSLAEAQRDVAIATLDAREQLALKAEPDEARRKQISLDFDKRRLALTQQTAAETAKAETEAAQARVKALDEEIAAAKKAEAAIGPAALQRMREKASPEKIMAQESWSDILGTRAVGGINVTGDPELALAGTGGIPDEQAARLRRATELPGAAERAAAATPEYAALQARRADLERQREQAAKDAEIARTRQTAVLAAQQAPQERIALQESDLARSQAQAREAAQKKAADEWLDQLGAAADAEAERARSAAESSFLRIKAANDALIAAMIKLGVNADEARRQVENLSSRQSTERQYD